MSITIHPERPDSPDATLLIQELDALLSPLYAVESRHGYSVQKLIDQQVEFFVVRVGKDAAGCGGVQWFRGNDPITFGELKRMYVRPTFRGQGMAKRLLDHFEELARSNGVKLLRLETGIYQTEAIRLYERYGYYRIPPFGSYREDPVSLCYEKRIG
ncbi:MAG TPA: GNAT family N-acetyltransferase [Caldilineaceae bacterium]|nr:GNAT family N-acetyltransferase [Caldilineaceae bacterium]